MPASPSTPAQPAGRRGRMLLLSPTQGVGGGIERVMDAVEAGWDGPVDRVDLVHGGGGHGSYTRVGPRAILGFTRRAVRQARAGRPDVVVCGLLGMLPVAALVAPTRRRRLVLWGYGVDVWGRIGPAQRLLVRRCTDLLTISSFSARVFAERAGVDPSAVKVVALPMAESIADAAAAQDPRPDAAPIVLTVSRVAGADRFKGHLDIAACFGRVLERRPDARWVVVGDGDGLPALRAECRRHGIEPSVELTGRITDEELVALYRRASVFVLPSYADADAVPPMGEGFGIVYVEAAAFGLPIVAADPGGGSSEFVIDGETGLTVPPRAPAELAAAILALLEDPPLRARIGAQARARAFDRHLPAHFRAALGQALR